MTSAPKTVPVQDKRAGSRDRNREFEAALGARIRAARVAIGLSMIQVADALGVTYQQVWKYELGQTRIAASTLRDIAADRLCFSMGIP